MDGTLHAEASVPAALRAMLPWHLLQGQVSKNVQLAVRLVEKTTVRNLIVDTNFRPGFDDREFDPALTPIYNGSTSSGAVVTEWYYFRTKKSINSGMLWKRFQNAPGAVGSNVPGLRWNKEISAPFEAQLPRHVAAAQVDRAVGAIKYDSLVLQDIVVSMIASKGAPQIVAFKNLNAGAITTVLAYKWDGPSGLLYEANPELPGDATRKSSWTAKGFQCAQSCLAVMGINQLIGYQTKLDLQWSQVLDGTINKMLGPRESSHHTASLSARHLPTDLTPCLLPMTRLASGWSARLVPVNRRRNFHSLTARPALERRRFITRSVATRGWHRKSRHRVMVSSST